jgi:pyridoxal phosphate enzyme (YggS family)
LTDIGDPHVIARNVRSVLEHIRRAALRAGRQPDEIRVIAATKSVPPEQIRYAIEAGVRILGENRLQEALPKITALASSGTGNGLSWHFIGRLQRRKAKAVVGLFELIHSVDSLELAAEIDRRAREANLRQPVLLEVNIGGETSKAGFSPSAVVEALTAVDAMPNLSVAGLMTVPPPAAEPEAVRPCFRRLRELAHALAGRGWQRVRLDELSMGMSQDYEIAVEEGATMVRIGTAIFGARPG